MSYFKFGDGPLYVFYIPFHLPHMQLPHSVARAVLFHDATLAPRGTPSCDTVTVAKKDLRAGEVLDGMGGFAAYGLVQTFDTCLKNDFLPMPLSVDCRLKRDIAKDSPIRTSDVDLPAASLRQASGRTARPLRSNSGLSCRCRGPGPRDCRRWDRDVCRPRLMRVTGVRCPHERR